MDRGKEDVSTPEKNAHPDTDTVESNCDVNRVKTIFDAEGVEAICDAEGVEAFRRRSQTARHGDWKTANRPRQG